MKVLELFSGTGSIGKICKARGYDVVSLDMKLPATIKTDINTWDYKKSGYPVGYFDLITASPVCLWWSRIRNSWIGRQLKLHPGVIVTREVLDQDIETYGKPMVKKTLEIIEYFNPKYYWIENPQTGRMKEFITDRNYYDVDYCKYADWGYKKRTRFWTNITSFTPKTCKKDCNSIKNGRHIKLIGFPSCIDDEGNTIILNNKISRDKYRQQGKKYKTDKSNDTTKLERYRIPPKLIEELLDGCCY